MCEGVESCNGSGGGGGDDTPTTTPTGYKVGATDTPDTQHRLPTHRQGDCVVSFHVNISGKTSGNTSNRIMRLLTEITEPG